MNVNSNLMWNLKIITLFVITTGDSGNTGDIKENIGEYKTSEYGNLTTDMNLDFNRSDMNMSSQLVEILEDKVGLRSRIESYTITAPEDNPYSVLILATASTGSHSVCPGSLLTDRWVLTSAHCVTGSLARLQVYAGGNSLQELSQDDLYQGSQLSDISEYIPHPLYDINGHMFDIALIKTEKRLNLTKTVNVIKLMTEPWPFEELTRCMITGFGVVQIGEDNYDDEMRKTHLLLVEKPCPCAHRMVAAYGSMGERVLICSKPMKDHGICSGDSGGGLVCDGMLMGIASEIYITIDADRCRRGQLFVYKDTKEKCGTKDTISVFTSSCPFLQWINCHVRLFESTEISPKCKEPTRSTAAFIICNFTFLLVFTELTVLYYSP